MSILRKLRMWYYTRKQIIENMQMLEEMLEIQMPKYLKEIEVLDQDKKYVMYDDCLRASEIKTAQRVFLELQKKIAWTLPQIIITNKPIKQLTKQELKLIAESIRGQERNNNIKTYN